MPNSSYEPWEERISAARDALNVLTAEMYNDLNPDRGGFGWWHGYTDARRLALLSEYLLSATEGVGNALTAASFEIDTYEKQKYADNTWLRQRWAALNKQRIPTTDPRYMAAMSERNGFERRREQRFTLAREHVFYHLAQAFDRLAAVVIGVGAMKLGIVKADWREVENLPTQTTPRWAKPLDDVGTPGRAAQDNVLADIKTALDAGPTDWLAWMLAMRNTSAHRAPTFNISVMVREAEPPPSFNAPFPRQPRWPSVEAMVARRHNAFEDLMLLRDPLAEMLGFLNQTSTVIQRQRPAAPTCGKPVERTGRCSYSPAPNGRPLALALNCNSQASPPIGRWCRSRRSVSRQSQGGASPPRSCSTQTQRSGPTSDATDTTPVRWGER